MRPVRQEDIEMLIDLIDVMRENVLHMALEVVERLIKFDGSGSFVGSADIARSQVCYAILVKHQTPLRGFIGKTENFAEILTPTQRWSVPDLFRRFRAGSGL